MPRRRFLQVSAAASALPLVGCGPVPTGTGDAGAPSKPSVDPDEHDDAERVAAFADDVPLDAAIFALGVQAGGMERDRALLWGYADDAAAKRLRVWREIDDESEVALVHDEDVTPAQDGTFRVEVAGLAPATTYRFALFVTGGEGALEARSEIGQVQTAWPDDWRWPLTLAAATCTSWENRPYVALEDMAAAEPDLFVHLGDMSYNDEAQTYEEYRELWHETLSDPGYRALLAKAGGYFAWDDHEFTNDLNPETIDAERLETAREAYFRHVAAKENESGGLWRSYRWGATAEIFILDCRTERRPSSRSEDASAYLGEEQRAWLKSALSASPCHFKVILNSVPMTTMPQLWGLTGDRWQGYPVARADLLTFLEEEGIEGVWFLSGDFHMGFVGRVGTEGHSRSLYEVAVGPSGNLGNPLGILLSDPENRELVFPAEQFLYGEGKIAATTLTFDPLRDVVRVRFTEAGTGDVLFDEEVGKES